MFAFRPKPCWISRPPSFIVYIHTPGKVVILQRPSLFLTSLSARKFISSEIGRFQLCGGNLTNIIRLESLGTCVMSSSFWISLSTRCVAYWWKPRKSAVCFYIYILVLCSKKVHNFFRENVWTVTFFFTNFVLFPSFQADVRLSRNPEGGITAWSELYRQFFYLAQFYISSAKDTHQFSLAVW